MHHSSGVPNPGQGPVLGFSFQPCGCHKLSVCCWELDGTGGAEMEVLEHMSWFSTATASPLWEVPGSWPPPGPSGWQGSSSSAVSWS